MAGLEQLAHRLFRKRRSLIETPCLNALLAAVYMAIAFAYFLNRPTGLWEDNGTILGHDFVNLWTAAKLALSGAIETLFEPNAFYAAQKTLIGPELGFHSWSYPPSLLLLIFPLGFLPYLPALIVCSLLGLCAFAFALQGLRFSMPSLLALTILAPSSFVALTEGHLTLFLAAALIGGLRLVPTRPFWGGLLLGLLSVKPHLALLIPFALLAGRHYRVFGGMVCSSLSLAALSLLIFGLPAWDGFIRHVMPHQARLLELEPIYTFQAMMPSFYAALRALSAGATLALAAHGVLALGLLCTVMRLFAQRAAPWPVLAAILCVGTLLATPYSLSYDMTFTSAAVLFMLSQEPQPSSRWMDGLLLMVWLLPLAVFWLNVLGAPLAPVILIAFFAALSHRAFSQRQNHIAPRLFDKAQEMRSDR